MTAPTATEPFLSGNFAPVQDEQETEALDVIGTLPPELNGVYVRNGPNPQFPPKGQYHWFDGDGMLHGVEIRHGKATYRNRFIRTTGFLKEQEAGHAIWTGLLEPAQEDLPEGPVKNAANTALVWHAGKCLALYEAAEPYQIDLPQLDTEGSYTFDGNLRSPVTAHPKVDPDTGEMLFFGYSFAPPYLQYSVVTAAGTLQSTVPIDLPVPVMMHDFAITETYTIFMDFPMTFRPERAAQGMPPLGFEADRPSRFGILPRHGSNDDIRWFEAPSCFAFHVLNAYEEADEVVLMACRMAAFDMTGTADPEQMIPYLYEWRFNLTTGDTQAQPLSPIPVDFPQINSQRVGRKMRYGFASKMAPSELPRFDGIVKFDFEHRQEGQPTPHVHELGADRYCGEAAFVPRPGATAEDDGWLVTFVHDENTERSELLIADAQQMSSEPVARVLMPRRVPYGFHGLWVSDVS